MNGNGCGFGPFLLLIWKREKMSGMLNTRFRCVSMVYPTIYCENERIQIVFQWLVLSSKNSGVC